VIAFNMAHLESICYKKNFLKKVIFKIDFQPILSIVQELPSKFQDGIREKFPQFKPIEGHEFAFEFSGKSHRTIHSSVLQWSFKDQENLFEVGLTNVSLSIVSNKYHDYNIFRDTVSYVIDKFQSTYKPILIRFGLQYINEIKIELGDPNDWYGFIAKPLADQMKNCIGDCKQVARQITQITYIKTDGLLKFTFGIPNSEFPSKISRKEFVLDYDCFINNPGEIEILNTLNSFHNHIQSLFEISIDTNLREYMGVENGK
jgi:uncharacterized protein (TIGR04255 family)